MDRVSSAPGNGATPASTAIATGPPLGCPAPTSIVPPATPPTAPFTLQQAWPRSAQWATAFLLGALLTLLTFHSFGYLHYGSRPTELERGSGLSYRVDLNHARRAELLQLPGVGPGMVQRIEAYREVHGGFRSVTELTRVHGIGPATLERLRPWVFVAADASQEEAEPVAVEARQAPALAKRPLPPAPAVKSKKAASLTGRIDLNEASAEELRRLPGIGPKLSQRIVDERLKGPFKTVDELRRVPGIGAKTLERLRPYISVQAKPVRIVAAE